MSRNYLNSYQFILDDQKYMEKLDKEKEVTEIIEKKTLKKKKINDVEIINNKNNIDIINVFLKKWKGKYLNDLDKYSSNPKYNLIK